SLSQHKEVTRQQAKPGLRKISFPEFRDEPEKSAACVLAGAPVFSVKHVIVAPVAPGTTVSALAR
ncbi:hypothetical protein, partial [Alcanivorax hongdengensis]|uniref:hypothetical protein n=1 Tax=Alcanivorax hongdengensis TaxID=519051 RepID=UPI001ED999EC